MKRWIAGILVVMILIPIALAPGEAWANGRFRRGHAHVGVWWPGIFLGGLAVGAAISAPYRYPYYPYYYYPDYYYAPPVVYQAAPTYVAPAPPQVQREVVYAHGKYVLYGDGVSQPWQWVWVPNAPAPPPPPPAR